MARHPLPSFRSNSGTRFEMLIEASAFKQCLGSPYPSMQLAKHFRFIAFFDVDLLPALRRRGLQTPKVYAWSVPQNQALQGTGRYTGSESAQRLSSNEGC